MQTMKGIVVTLIFLTMFASFGSSLPLFDLISKVDAAEGNATDINLQRLQRVEFMRANFQLWKERMKRGQGV